MIRKQLLVLVLMLVSVTASAPVPVPVLVPVAVRGEIADAAVLESPPGRAGRSSGRGSQPERSAEAQRSRARVFVSQLEVLVAWEF